MRCRYIHEPHPHIVIDEIVPADVYRTMRFPDELVAPNAAWGITASDASYAEVLRDPAWRALHDELRGEPFVRSVLTAFADDMHDAGCPVDPVNFRLTSYVRSREWSVQGSAEA